MPESPRPIMYSMVRLVATRWAEIAAGIRWRNQGWPISHTSLPKAHWAGIARL